ncbi:tetraacyldisaccharide 4'-kinase [Rhodobium orientis]|uniref:Tetraacyldisaccharide 4'-kinase n=1 Tax=Rhodobium orientis TaxID=34017 RepID=A0A327JPR7_9HYPH|nr:tetraacyldisaccharide 4'-kinase [Rhodobium orientis]MBB4304203.1 tetraacyldisaccharide 4'-kinase [Rhodobium orientis]MBK5950673.1 tetraacyldisaccharide 4'-kinase [Rhodobium orientis]RAI28051.1 tetraacyldisaccharide 4'-kinase [Rhodobium orientis]
MNRAPGFWWQKDSLASRALWPVSTLYGAIAGHRMYKRPRLSPGVPVICVGNFTMGGAGKTPVALAVVRMLLAAGKTPAVLTRGYGGRLKGPVLADPEVHTAAHIGDEALLLAGIAPVVVGADRVAGAAMAIEAGADVLVMDDGFQNHSLAKTLSLVVVDAAAGIGNGLVFPAGPLRAPLDTQLQFADAIVAVGAGPVDAELRTIAADYGIPLHAAVLAPENGADFEGKRVLAFAGIGRPEKFFESLTACGADVAGTPFADHHVFTDVEAERLLARAESEGRLLVTTEKDAARMKAAKGAVERLHAASRVLKVSIDFADEGPKALVLAALGARTARNAKKGWAKVK